jgi:manganese-dependent ADP-ribose/CDP-alcohol diphosphatase
MEAPLRRATCKTHRVIHQQIIGTPVPIIRTGSSGRGWLRAGCLAAYPAEMSCVPGLPKWLMVAAGLLFAVPCVDEGVAEEPEFAFGVVADVQYADKETSGKRRYRESLGKLQEAVEDLNGENLLFTVNLGDSIDGRDEESRADLREVTQVFEGSKAPVRHVIGNHCLELRRRQLMDALGLASAHYSFVQGDWMFVVLDTMDISLKAEPGSEELAEAEAWLERDPTLPTYNGAVGDVQLRWLEGELQRAWASNQRVVIFSHHPFATESGHESLLAWNAAAMRRLLARSGCVVACFSGHDHEGAYVLEDGIHYLTVPGMVEASEESNRYAVVEVYGDRLEVLGRGEVESRSLSVRDAGDGG